MKLVLLDSDYHQSGNAEPVATAYKVYRGEKRLSEKTMYIRRISGGEIRTSPNYERRFGDLLTEKHPTRTVRVRSGHVPCPRYVLYWSALERYAPLSAEALAARRLSRERNKAEQAEEQWAKDKPFLAWAETIQRQEEEEQGPENAIG